jgi:hypothetical protein
MARLGRRVLELRVADNRGGPISPPSRRMVLNRVHLLELSHVSSAEAARLALGLRDLAVGEITFSLPLSPHLDLDLIGLLSKLIHEALRVLAKWRLSGALSEAEGKLCRWDPRCSSRRSLGGSWTIGHAGPNISKAQPKGRRWLGHGRVVIVTRVHLLARWLDPRGGRRLWKLARGRIILFGGSRRLNGWRVGGIVAFHDV